MVKALTIIALIAVAVWGQQYYEVSGKTQVFTLTPGAKSGPTAIRGGSVMSPGKNSSINLTVARVGIVIMLPAKQQGSVDIALYDIAGRQIYRQHGYCGTSLRLETKAFAAGIYTALVRVDGKNYSRRFAVSRRGE
jgi:hypothetical protein